MRGEMDLKCDRLLSVSIQLPNIRDSGRLGAARAIRRP
jgi:hypothetical protein